MPQRVSLFLTARASEAFSPVAKVDQIVEFKHVVRAIVKNHGNCSVVLRFLGSADNVTYAAETTVPAAALTIPAKSERSVESYLTAARQYFKFGGVATQATVGGVVYNESEVEVELREIVPTTGLTIR